jgi:hypothetical protein
MIRTLTRIYRDTKNEELLSAAVRKMWITEIDKQAIIAGE